MVVGADRTWGSVGGGNLEAAAIERARELIATAATGAARSQESRLNEHAHNEHGRQCCGGVVRLLLEPLPARPVVAIFGVGHVGYELARILSRLEIRCTWSTRGPSSWTSCGWPTSPTAPPTSSCTTGCSASRCSSGCRAAPTC